MNLSSRDPRLQKAVSNVGLITSNGSFGHNIMACEWTNIFSFEPAMISLGIRPHKATAQNIHATKAFGVNICAQDQNLISSVAGNYTGKEIDKIALLESLGYSFYQAESANLLMVQGASLNAECELVKTVDLGDHPLLIGKIKVITASEKQPLVYFQGRYHKIGDEIHKPSREYRNKIKQLAQEFNKDPKATN